MKCIKCGSENVQLDELTSMYYCPDCKSLYSEGEGKDDKDSKEVEVVEKHRPKHRPDTNPYVHRVSKAKQWHRDDLSGFSLIVLNVFASIPVISALIPILISYTNVKEVYTKFFSYRFLSRVVIFIIAIFYGALICKDFEINLQKTTQSALYKVVSAINPAEKNMVDVSNIPSTETVDVLGSIDLEQYEGEEELTTLTKDNLKLFDGSVLTGKTVMSIVKGTKDKQCAYLVQTEGVAERHGRSSYRVLGWIINGADKEDSGSNYFSEEQKSYSFYHDDYGKLVKAGIEDLENRKCIYYINPNNDYNMKVLYSVEDEVVGFLFKEIVSKKK